MGLSPASFARRAPPDRLSISRRTIRCACSPFQLWTSTNINGTSRRPWRGSARSSASPRIRSVPVGHGAVCSGCQPIVASDPPIRPAKREFLHYMTVRLTMRAFAGLLSRGRWIRLCVKLREPSQHLCWRRWPPDCRSPVRDRQPMPGGAGSGPACYFARPDAASGD